MAAAATPRGTTPRLLPGRGGGSRPSALSGDVVGRTFGLAASDAGHAAPGAVDEHPLELEKAATTPRPDPKEEPSDTEAVRLRQCYIRDNVAFLLGRAPDTSHPPVELKMLEMATPRSLVNVASATKDCHGLAAIEGADRLDGLYTRKRDRVTEYMEILMQQSHLVRKK
mmetsp:Transcript_3268/g.6760  ORF Transcript_3268/g.6760 Transcript_3268/m.6760 type:complete len:169 (-) Transcript_3268:74-580(-)